jgi:bacteriocin-like protein
MQLSEEELKRVTGGSLNFAKIEFKASPVDAKDPP